MQIVINISPQIRATLNDETQWSALLLAELQEAINNGKPLPKGHGRLGDLDALEREMINGIKAGYYEDGFEDYPNINCMDDCVDAVKYADTIIEADEVEE